MRRVQAIWALQEASYAAVMRIRGDLAAVIHLRSIRPWQIAICNELKLSAADQNRDARPYYIGGRRMREET